jgi:hypothetical protein
MMLRPMCWLAAGLLVFGCNLGGQTASTPTLDVPVLSDQQVLQLVLQRIPSETNRQGLREYAQLEYLGHGEWLIRYGSDAAWLVRERESRASRSTSGRSVLSSRSGVASGKAICTAFGLP